MMHIERFDGLLFSRCIKELEYNMQHRKVSVLYNTIFKQAHLIFSTIDMNCVNNV